MRRKMLCSISLTATSVLCLMVFQQAALAGPPLICHPFDIGNARSLPFKGPDWREVDKNYDINRLVEDTVALLTPETPVLVRMETIRRATVYAVLSLNDYSAKNAAVADELLSRLKARIPDPGVKSDKKATALALFDYGYAVESYKQAGAAKQGTNLTGASEGYGLIVKALALDGGDPEMEFAAAVACWDRAHIAAHIAHLQRAVAGAQEGSLLARNLLTHFRDRGKTMAELRASVATAKN